MKNLRTTLKRWLSEDSTNPKNYLQNAVDTGKKFSPDNTTSIEVNTNISVYRKKDMLRFSFVLGPNFIFIQCQENNTLAPSVRSQIT